MIECYFNATGYLIRGEGLEICRKVSPLTGDDGQPVFDELQHLMIVLFAMIGDLVGRELGYKPVHVYNDSRVIDDMQGHEPLEHFCADVRRKLRQKVFPYVDGNITYHKRTAREVADKLEEAYARLFPQTRDLEEIHTKQTEGFRRSHNQRVQRLREPWAEMMRKRHGTG